MRPVRIEYRSKEQILVLEWPDHREEHIPAALLRVCSPSAEVQGHGPGSPGVVPTHVDGVSIVAMEPVGAYAIKIHFSDGHHTGIFSWSYLTELAGHKDQLWEEYQNALLQPPIPKADKNLLE